MSQNSRDLEQVVAAARGCLTHQSAKNHFKAL